MSKSSPVYYDYEFIRLYNKNGDHLASLLSCGHKNIHWCGKGVLDKIDDSCTSECRQIVTEFDLCRPGGSVLFCGILPELFESFGNAGFPILDLRKEPQKYDYEDLPQI